MDLRQIEADVVIVLMLNDHGFIRGKVIPIWECEENSFVLIEIAEQEALAFAEKVGHGAVSYRIYDFRKQEGKSK